jgi:PAS domain S-box-containing protein
LPEHFGLGELFNRVRDAVVVADVESGRIVLWNPAAQGVFGFSADQAAALSLDALIPDRFRSAHHRGVQQYRETGHGAFIDDERPVEVVGLRADGSLVPVELTLAPLPVDERRFVMAILRDVSERRRAEDERERLLSAAESALRTRDEFLRSLAHDLKSPLANLSWHVQSLDHRARQGTVPTSTLGEALRAILFDAAEAVGAIDELQDLTRLAAGAPIQLQREPIDLVGLATQLVDARHRATSLHLELDCSVSSLMIRGDAARLSRVLDNLLDNAAKYSAREGRIQVILEREAAGDTEWAVVRVRDYGLGIPESDLPNIFARYQRGSNVAHIRGEGLGLSSVRQIVELHDGRLEIQSQEGVGSTFTICLPLEASPLSGSASAV